MQSTPRSNVRFFLVIIPILLLAGSCRKSKLDVIPEVLVDFYLDLNDPSFFDLNAVGNNIVVNSSTNNLGIYAAGFDGNGIIVYRAQLDEFIALDRTCPYDYALDGTSVAVDIGSGELFARCPACESEYALPSFGTPSSGPSKYPLKVYRTTFDGRFVHVFN